VEAVMKRRSDDEIVKEIVKVITKAIRKDKRTESVDETEIRACIDALRKPNWWDFKSRKHNAEYAQDFIEWIKAEERLLAGRPEALDPHILFCTSRGGFNFLDTMTLTYLRKPMKSFKDLLADMRWQCELIIKNKIGKHGNSEEPERAASASAALMDYYSLPWAYASDKSAYREVARLLFEAMTDRAEADMSRACRVIKQERDAIIRRRQLPLTTRT
jgi:hypothetical protein